MDLRTLLLSGDYQFECDPPAAESSIEALIAATPVPLPCEYLELLRLSDGGEADMSGYPRYVRIWSALKAIENNRDYEVAKWLPGFIGFGDNGGPDMIGFDTRSGPPFPVCSVMFVPMEWESAMGTVPNFDIFIRQLLKHGDIND
ncbi:SMI1/KNR4 family protein [Pseudomonas phytophila]|uniref:SMI1/KNR4 family protein n=1 Tax=Pseudomonas phytophila TaxID=2867264 RepID=A0ABY6F9M0_9PSED|nr:MULTISPECIES: SMI1/KNR4 family protein [Pseudomonas]MCQ2999949.1 SMI1/KNR4 family protein [Pseudomonas syringae]PHN17132.1 hypothetical protein AO242_20740 [Pseudomonas sp. ICMP 561]UXZ94576.1 SMI1/KNR4 family protein [Pseudomonas phytophila]